MSSRLLLHPLVFLLISNNENKIQVTQNKFVRYILKFDPGSHIRQSQLDTLNYLRIQDRVSQQRLNRVYNIKNGSSPQYLCQNIRKINEIHGRNTRSNALLFALICKTKKQICAPPPVQSDNLYCLRPRFNIFWIRACKC